MGPSRSLARVFRLVLLVLIAGLAVAYVALGARQQWDFETYYYAGAAYRAGLNPYALDALSSVAGKTVELPFLYPPVTLAIFVPLSLLSIHLAAGLWLGLKSLLLVFLVWLWGREFLGGLGLTVLLSTTLLGFNLAVLWDLRTGNVAIIEAAILWLAFTNYIRRRLLLTALLIALASAFKLLPILLLGVIAMSRQPAKVRLRWMAVGVAVLLTLVAWPTPLLPGSISALSSASVGNRPYGDINPSALGMADWFVSTIELPASAGPVVSVMLYLAYCAAILASGLRILFREYESDSRVDQVISIVLLWLLLSPRVMVYSYVMAIVPVLYVVQKRVQSLGWRAAAIALLLAEGIVRLLPGRPPAILGPLSFLLLLGAWLLWIRTPSTEGQGKAAPCHSGSLVV